MEKFDRNNPVLRQMRKQVASDEPLTESYEKATDALRSMIDSADIVLEEWGKLKRIIEASPTRFEDDLETAEENDVRDQDLQKRMTNYRRKTAQAQRDMLVWETSLKELKAAVKTASENL